MTLEEIKNKYTNKKFVEVDDVGNNVVVALDIDDFMSLDDVFLYCKLHLDSDDITEHLITQLISDVENSLEETMGYEVRSIIRNVAEDYRLDHEEELARRLHVDDIDTFKLRSLHNSVWYQPDDIPDIEDFDALSSEVINTIKDLVMTEINGHVKKSKEADAFVNSYREEYMKATTKTDKTKLINDIQYLLQKNYGCYPFVQKYTKDFIRCVLEGLGE